MTTVVLSANTSWYLYNFRASTLRALIDKGYHVVCLSPEDDYSGKLESELGCQWLPLKMDNQGSNPFRDMALVLQFWRAYRKIRPAVVCHFTIKNNVYGTWAARVLGIPAINNVSGLGTAFVHKGLVSLIVRLLYRTSQRFAHTVFCQNEDDLNQLRELNLVPADRLKLVPGSGVDLDRFRPVSGDKKDDRPFRFLYAGRMLLDKGLAELREAMHILHREGHSCTLWLVGFSDAGNASSMSEAELREWAKEQGVEWLGPCDQMEDVYRQVDCVVLPSYREGIPRSLLEAGSMGLPIITTNVPGCRALTTHGYNGYLCEARSSDSLSKVMEQMSMLSHEERSQMGINGRTLVEANFDEAQVVDMTIRAVDSAIQGRDITEQHIAG